ncbi:MAG: hypothetical protein E7426_03340 [Ruminococcaceae bacterium]|nr:hypothetical protein [Oscillospiraceae bacterium]
MGFGIKDVSGIYTFDKDWRTYLKDKSFAYYDSVIIRQEKKSFGHGALLDTWHTVEDPTPAQQEREKGIADFCRQHEIPFQVNTQKYQTVFHAQRGDPVRKRLITIDKDAEFVVPAPLSTSLLHEICKRGYESQIERYEEIASARKSEELSAEAKKAAMAAGSMIYEDVLQFRRISLRLEYPIHIIVNANDFRYTEPNEDISGIVFQNEGVAPLLSKEGRALFLLAVMRELREKILNTDKVLDALFMSPADKSPLDCETDLLVLYL